VIGNLVTDRTTRLFVVYDERHRLHRAEFHPENPERIETILASLRESPAWRYAELLPTPEPDVGVVMRIHSEKYVRFVEEESMRGFHWLDPDTYINEHTFEIAVRFATAAYRAAAESFRTGAAWLILPRPGGHHAGVSGRAMGAPTLGFCIFNTAAAAAAGFIDAGASRVMMIDIDAHHGNGTQDIFWSDPRVLHVDIHEWGIYPGTGWVTDIGGRGAEGTKVNVPLEAYSGDGEYEWILRRVVEPLAGAFKPEAVVVSLGVDAFAGDPLTNLMTTRRTYEAFGKFVGDLVRSGRVKGVVVVVEGGYGVRGLREGVRGFVEGLLGLAEPASVEKRSPRDDVARELRRILANYWNTEL